MKFASSSKQVFGASSNQGFTLVELLVGAAILTVMMLFLTQLFGSASIFWREAENRFSATRDARAAIQRMSRELGNLKKLRNDDTFLIRKNFYSDTPPGTNNQEIYFSFSNRMGVSGDGDIVAAGYYTQYATGCYVLRRCFIDSRTLYRRLTKTPLPKKIVGSVNNILGIPIGVRSAVSDDNSDIDSVFVPCVWDLKFNIATIDSTGNIRMSGNSDLELKGSDRMPIYIDVSFKTIGGADVQRVIARNIPPDDWFNPSSTNYTYFIAPKMRTYSTRIFITNRTPPTP